MTLTVVLCVLYWGFSCAYMLLFPVCESSSEPIHYCISTSHGICFFLFFALPSSPALHWWICGTTYHMLVCTLFSLVLFSCGGWEREKKRDHVCGCALYEDGFVEGASVLRVTYSRCLTVKMCVYGRVWHVRFSIQFLRLLWWYFIFWELGETAVVAWATSE
jgi:hypothetical protein